MRAIPQGG